MHPILVVFFKEVRDNLRDRRSLLSALIYPLLGPLLFGLMLNATHRVLDDKAAAEVVAPVPVVGAEYAPVLMEHLAANNLRPVPGPALAEVEEAVKSGRLDLVLVVPRDFERLVAEGRSPALQLVNDTNTLSAELLAGRIGRLLNEQARAMSARTLSARGVDPAVLEPFTVTNVILSARREATDLFLFMVPPFIMFTIFIGGVYLAIDVTSGERERGSLEPLMANPVPRWQFMFGKFLAAYLFTAVALVIQLSAFTIVFQTLGAGRFSVDTAFGAMTALKLFLVAVPLMAFTVAVQIIVAGLTRSFKEAQTWLGLLPLVPAAPGLVMVFLPVSGKLWMMLLPILAQTVTMGQVVRGQPVGAIHLALSALATLAAAYLLLRYAARLFEREEIIFGG